MLGVLAFGWNGSLAAMDQLSYSGPPGIGGPPGGFMPGGGAGAIGAGGAPASGPLPGAALAAICWIAAGTRPWPSCLAKLAVSARTALSTACCFLDPSG